MREDELASHRAEISELTVQLSALQNQIVGMEQGAQESLTYYGFALNDCTPCNRMDYTSHPDPCQSLCLRTVDVWFIVCIQTSAPESVCTYTTRCVGLV